MAYVNWGLGGYERFSDTLPPLGRERSQDADGSDR